MYYVGTTINSKIIDFFVNCNFFCLYRYRYFCDLRYTGTSMSNLYMSTGSFRIIKYSVEEPEPVEPKLFSDLEPEPKIDFNKHFLQSVLRMLG